MNNLLVLKRLVDRYNTPKMVKNKNFNENQKCAIAISGILDKHKGIKPSIIECFSVPDLYAKLRFVLPKNGMPPYQYVLDCIKDNGFFQLIKHDVGYRY